LDPLFRLPSVFDSAGEEPVFLGIRYVFWDVGLLLDRGDLDLGLGEGGDELDERVLFSVVFLDFSVEEFEG
jgi:hypothetical protein